MGIPLLRGRDFSAADQYDQPFVAIVSESLAKKSFPNQDPIGRKIICGLDSDKWMTIVGVVGDVRSDGPGQAPGPELYMPFQQHPIMANELQIAVRTSAAPEAMANAVERKIRSLNPEIALKTTTMRAMISDSTATPRFRTFLVVLFAGVALLLAMAGVYGVMAYLVTQRTSELGLRMALGSAPSGVVALVLARAGTLAGVGLIGGVALAVSRFSPDREHALRRTCDRCGRICGRCRRDRAYHSRRRGHSGVARIANRSGDCAAQRLAHIEQTEAGQLRILEQPPVEVLFLQHRELRGGHFAAVRAKLRIKFPPRLE